MISRFLRTSSRNVFVGIAMLILLGVVTAPNITPRLLGQLIPGFYEGVPCTWLRTGDDRAAHQSLLGRNLQGSQPLSLDVVTTTLPRDPAGVLTIRIILTNNSMATLALNYNAETVMVGDNGTSGLGIIFTPNINVPIGQTRQDSPTVPEGNIRLLGPRQKCVHTILIPAGNLLIDPTFAQGTAQVRAYYRNNSAGAVSAAQTTGAALYPDQGLWIGAVESAPVSIPVGVQ